MMSIKGKYSLLLSVLECDNFKPLRGRFTIDGDITVVPGHNMSADECQYACVKQPRSQYCVAANVHLTGVCILAGYKLTKKQNNVHFRRFCGKGKIKH